MRDCAAVVLRSPALHYNIAVQGGTAIQCMPLTPSSRNEDVSDPEQGALLGTRHWRYELLGIPLSALGASEPLLRLAPRATKGIPSKLYLRRHGPRKGSPCWG
jgi:hypothetical protein